MPSLWFVVPVHGRLELATICLRQLRRTCDALEHEGIRASAVIVSEQEEIDALDVGQWEFSEIARDNRSTSRRFNDGIQLALDPAYNPHPADYVVPCGSDDWVDHCLLLDIPPPDTIVGFQRMAFVREDGQEITFRELKYPGGCGIRIYPRRVMELAVVPYRPADEDRTRGCDTSILTNLQRRVTDIKLRHDPVDPRQLVDWKTPGQQLNTYTDLNRHRRSGVGDPWEELQGWWPDVALEDMRAHYANALVPA